MRLSPMRPPKHKYPFYKAHLNDCGGDLSKRWYIEYGIFDHETQKVIRRRNYRLFSKVDSKEERYALAKDAIKKLNKNLPFVSWNHPDRPETKEKKQRKERTFYTLEDALNMVIDLKYQVRESRKTHHSFKSHMAKLVEYNKVHDLIFFNVRSYKKVHAQQFADDLLRQGLKPQTVKNRITALRAMFGHLLDREIIELNPFVGIKLPKIVKSNYNESYTDEEIETIKKYCLEHDPVLWRAIQIIFYTYLRPIELSRLKVKHLKLEDKQIFIPGEISKNQKDLFIVITEPLMNMFLEEMEVDKANPEHYLFTKNGMPGAKQIGYNFLGNHYKRVSDTLNLPEQKTLYAWKHTGVVKAYKAGVDLKAIQLQCRHSSIEQTDTYLKSLGFHRNDAFLDGMTSL